MRSSPLFPKRSLPGAALPLALAILLGLCALPALPALARAQSREAAPPAVEGAAAAPRQPFRECGSVLTPETARRLAEQEAAGLYQRKQLPGEHRTDFVLQVPLTIHVVRRGNGTGGIADSTVNNTIAHANLLFEPAGIRFYRFGSTLYIDSDSLYLGINTAAEIDLLRQTAVVVNTVNVYFTENLAEEGGGLCGKASFTPDAVQGVVMSNNCTTRDGILTTFAHELGHFFDLYHTHETAFGVECPSGSNCNTAGDRLCDTPADPELSSATVNSSCQYTGSQTACEGEAYAPDPRNLMSYASPKNCRDFVSPQQRSKVLATLLNLRPELIPGQLAAVYWVGYEGTQNLGTYTQPWWMVTTAHALAPAGARVVLKPGSYPETLTFTRPMTLDSFLGPASIGPP